MTPLNFRSWARLICLYQITPTLLARENEKLKWAHSLLIINHIWHCLKPSPRETHYPPTQCQEGHRPHRKREFKIKMCSFSLDYNPHMALSPLNIISQKRYDKNYQNPYSQKQYITKISLNKYYRGNYQTSKLYLLVNKLIPMQRTENSRKKLWQNFFLLEGKII